MATRYQRGNQKAYIEGQTTQWPKEKKTKQTNNDLQNITQKTSLSNTKPTKNRG
jgi:hypothetical protein